MIERQLENAEEFEFKNKPVYDFFKRAFDIICALLALIFFSPLFIVIMLIIYSEDKGNPIYAQERVGKNQVIFKMYKFRSMRINAEKEDISVRKANGLTSARMFVSNDPRVTKIGKFIRRYSIDELPQCINILKGNMTVIGPRPLIIYENEHYKDNSDFLLRYKVKPGLSCYEQISKRDAANEDKWIEYDKKYLKDRSFATDLKIIFLTIAVVFRGNNH